MPPSGLFISICILVALSTFFSLSETAIVSVPEEKIFKMQQNGNAKAKVAMKILANKEKIVSITLLCDNLVNIAASSLSAVCFAEWFGQYDEIGILLSTIIMTIIVFIFGEVLPKMIALRQPTKITLLVSPFFLLLWKVLYPVIWLINKLIEKMVAYLHIKNEEDSEKVDDAILGAVEMYHKRGLLENDEKEMLSGILQLDDVDMKDIMTHRSDMFAIDINEKIEDIVAKITHRHFTKIPFYDKSIDKMIGVLKVNDLMLAIHENGNDVSKVDIRKLLKPTWYLPGDACVGKHLQDFKNKSNALAVVVDEYGGTMGIATFEDVLEQIVGDIKDGYEENKEERKILKNKDGSFILDADISLQDVNEMLNSNFKDNEISTIGGFLLNKIDKIAKQGEKFIIDGYEFTILKAEATNVEKIKICRKNIDNNGNG